MKINLIVRMIILCSIVLLVFVVVENANTTQSTLEPYSNTVYENPKSNTRQDIITNFGLLVVTLLLLVLAKSFFDFIRIRNQSLLISY